MTRIQKIKLQFPQLAHRCKIWSYNVHPTIAYWITFQMLPIQFYLSLLYIRSTYGLSSWMTSKKQISSTSSTRNRWFLAPSGALVFIMVYNYKATFSNFSNLEQSCLYTFIYNFHFHSVFNIWNRTSQYFGMNDIDNARMHVHISSRFYKVLQISLRPKMCYIF